jgi:hypothetical protein
LIETLKGKGQVYLVRLPISKEFYQLETSHFMGFDERIREYANDLSVPYWDMVGYQDSVKYNDGHHINRYFAPLISKKIAEWIRRKE